MKTHRMSLQPKYYNFIKNGTKRIELRLLDEKRRGIAPGDSIEFRADENERLEAKVIDLLRYDTFRRLLDDFDISILADKSMTKEELLADLEEFYPPEKQNALGVIGIQIEIKNSRQ